MRNMWDVRRVCCVLAASLALGGFVIASSATAADAKAAKPAAKAAKVDLNTATEKQLQDLPGIGEAYSKKIIAARPLRVIEDLGPLGIPAPTIEKLRPLVKFGSPKPPKKGMVWVNTATKVYHKQGSPYYGLTKEGKWMTEADAIKAGNKAAGE